MTDKKTFNIAVQSGPTPAVEEVGPPTSDNHANMMQAAIKFAVAPTKKSNLTEVAINKVYRKSRLLFLLLPNWNQAYAPYNVARLVALTKENGYKTDAIDLNSKAFNDHKNWGIDFDPWSPTRDWKWRGESYHTDLHEHLEPLLQKYLDYITETKPTVIGMTLYYCNEEPSKWLAKEIKKRHPEMIIIVGGSQAQESFWKPIPEFDYVVSGEGEKILLEILEEIELTEKPPAEQVWIKQEDGQRLSLDALPMPDYSHFDFSEYGIPNGVNSEISRGCIAKCTFCSETHFWKYRGRTANSVLDEITELYHTRGITFVNFIDSLVNGNLKELRAFAEGVIERGLKINWMGYARNDKRMDAEYMKLLGESGCSMLNYGCESGSNKVLDAMNKKVTREEIEANFRDGAAAGITAATNWIVGFPNEEPQDLYETLTLIWRNRNMKVGCLSNGVGFSIPPGTIVAQNFEKYDILNSFYLDNWSNSNFTKTKMHRLVRVKLFTILEHYLITHVGLELYGMRPGMGNFYNLTCDAANAREMEFEEFDFNIIKPGISSFADSLVNEIWPLLRLWWCTLGAFKVQIIFDPEKDANEYGPMLSGGYSAVHNFDIDADGNWTADFSYDYKDIENGWTYADFNHVDSIGANRARKLAIEGSDGKAFFSNDRYQKIIARQEELNKIDFSFKYQYNGTGKW